LRNSHRLRSPHSGIRRNGSHGNRSHGNRRSDNPMPSAEHRRDRRFLCRTDGK